MNRLLAHRPLAVAAALLVVSGSSMAAMNASAARAAELTPRPAADFTLTLADGKKVTLAQLRGQVVMINFWASWCGPCRQEMPLLDAMYKKYKAMGFTLVGVNVEPDSKEAQDFLRAVPVSFPIAFDTDSKLTKTYDVQGMPSSVIIDRRGNARIVHKGYKPGDENEYLDNIRTLIRE